MKTFLGSPTWKVSPKCKERWIGQWKGLYREVVELQEVIKKRLDVAPSAMMWLTSWCSVIAWTS